MANELLSEEEFKQVLPAKMRKNVSSELMAQINATISDPIILETFKDNLLSFASVMQQGKFKMSSYICAIKYVSYKAMGDTNKDAYIKTFPGKYQNFVQSGVCEKDIASYSTAYNKSKLVNLIMEQTLIPVHILNAPAFQAALNVQTMIMHNSDASFKVRSDAANSVMTQLKPPEIKKMELDVTYKEDDSIQALRETTMELARQHKLMIEDGSASVDTIAGSTLVKTDVEEAELVEDV
jgi:hypothetical protein